MTPRDLRLLCTALGFAAVASRAPQAGAPDAVRVRQLAGLIESFCLDDAPPPASDAPRIDDRIEAFKRRLRDTGHADLHDDRATLLALHARLCQRYAALAGDDMLADRVLELIDAELDRESIAAPDA